MRAQTLLLLAAVAGTYACKRESLTEPAPIPPPPPSVAGWLDVHLDTPEENDGGLLFTVSGGRMDSLRSDFRSYHAVLSDTAWRVLLTGQLSPGLVARIRVPDLDAAERYSARLQQVAARGSYTQRGLAGYQLRIVRP